MACGLRRVIHHPDYYLDDGSVSFLTEGVLFRVHKSFFQRESDVFRDLFESTVNDVPLPGTDECPFTLDVTPEDFALFLWVWYDREHGYRQQTKDNWLTILRVATRWNFKRIEELALREIEFLEPPPAETTSAYDNHDVDSEHLVASCDELCKSPSLPIEDETYPMDMDTVIKILQAREDAQRKAVKMGRKTPTSACLEDDALREIVSKSPGKGSDYWLTRTSLESDDQASDLDTARKTLDVTSTIVIREPQLPDRKAQTASQPLSYLTPQQIGDGRGNQEKQSERAENNEHAEGSQVAVWEIGKKLAQVEKDDVEGAVEKEQERILESDPFLVPFFLTFLFWHTRTIRYAFASLILPVAE